MFFGRVAYGILVPQPGTELMLPPLEIRSPNHCTTRKIPRPLFLMAGCQLIKAEGTIASNNCYLHRWLRGKESTCQTGDAGDAGSIPGSGRSPGGGNGNPLKHSCWENPMDRGAWWATVQGVPKHWTRLRTRHAVNSHIHSDD